MLGRLVILAVAAAIAAVFLVSTNQRLLVWETKVTPGDTYVVKGNDLGKSQQPSLVCRYFTGIDVVTQVMAYQPSSGNGGCPILAENAA
ncbi:MAG: hypothetical protein JNL04_17630 [Rhodospirillaceae bacterium]|nr:hypothetical protein [Rhodospirillaceae bacterium]